MAQSDNNFWTLMARSLSGEATPEEQSALQAALEGNTELQQHYDLMQRTWINQPSQQNGTDQLLDARIDKILAQASAEETAKSSGRGKVFNFWFRVAAILIIVIVGAILLKPSFQAKPKLASQVLETVKGSRSRNVLPDGSVVWLNAGSRLHLAPGFNSTNRELTLIGEGYFDVVKSKSVFVVNVQDLKLTVLGTAFNVKFFPGDKQIETTLIRGRLKVTRQGKDEVVLKPNEKLVIETVPSITKTTGLANHVQVLEVELPSEIIETAWMYNRLEFRGDDFETLAAKLERWYNVEINFEDEKSKKLSFNGSFEKESIEQAFSALQFVAPFKYKIVDNEIYISSP